MRLLLSYRDFASSSWDGVGDNAALYNLMNNVLIAVLMERISIPSLCGDATEEVSAGGSQVGLKHSVVYREKNTGTGSTQAAVLPCGGCS